MKSASFNVLEHANGTKTLVDAENGQAMHSRIGPEAEARKVYADLARVEERLDDERARAVVWDVGMGIAANAIAALDRLRQFSGPKTRRGTLEIVSFESKPEGLREALARAGDFPMLAPWRSELGRLLDDGRTELAVGEVRVAWRLAAGDFFRTLEGEPSAPDIVFYDFYSPKVVPELWSRASFERLRRAIGDRDCRLFTYSAATPVRLRLLLAGFFVGEGVSTGIKSETTVAATRIESLDRPLRREWLSKLETSASIADEPGKNEVRAHPQWTA